MTNNKKVYVTMTDKFLSGWGKAANKIAKYVYECDNYDEAEVVADNARHRNDQKNVRITCTKPYYNSSRYLVMNETKEDNEDWYTPGSFNR